MTRNEMVEALASYFRIELPDTDDDGNYVCEGYDWEAGAYTDGEDDFGWHTFLSLENVVEALEDLCEEEDDDWDDEE